MRVVRTGLIAIVALGLLTGQAVGGAAQGEQGDPMAPSFFSGTVGTGLTNAMPVSDRRADGVVEYSGESYTFPVDVDDPRFSGTATIVLNEMDYREGATTLAPTGPAGTIRSGRMRIVNDGGSCEGEYQNLKIDSLGFEQSAGWLTGTGAYDGLSAYWVWDDYAGSVRGHITAEGPPPVPEQMSE